MFEAAAVDVVVLVGLVIQIVVAGMVLRENSEFINDLFVLGEILILLMLNVSAPMGIGW